MSRQPPPHFRREDRYDRDAGRYERDPRETRERIRYDDRERPRYGERVEPRADRERVERADRDRGGDRDDWRRRAERERDAPARDRDAPPPRGAPPADRYDKPNRYADRDRTDRDRGDRYADRDRDVRGAGGGAEPRGYAYRRRSRSRSPPRLDRRAIEEGRRRREEERARGVVFNEDGTKVVPKDETEESTPAPDPAEELDDETAAMAAMMGMSGFGSSKGAAVEGNDVGETKINKKRTWRQYMNRKGGFNRALDKLAG